LCCSEADSYTHAVIIVILFYGFVRTERIAVVVNVWKKGRAEDLAFLGVLID